MEPEEVELPDVLSEFRIALQNEIEAARRQESSSAVPLINGRRIAQVGQNFQYLFTIENALNLPGDAPGDLYLPKHAPISVIIISVDGLAITISVPENLGEFVAHARIQSNMASLMRKLIERIEFYSNKKNIVGDRVRGEDSVSGAPAQIDTDSFLNKYQADAVKSSLGHDTTYIWGPPGTGKTQTIGEIGKQLFNRDRSVLVVSHTNSAVDQAILRIGQLVPQKDVQQGKVIRVGDPKDDRLRSGSELLLDTHVAKKAQELTDRKQVVSKSLIEAQSESKRLSRLLGIFEWLGYAAKDIGEMDDKLRQLLSKENSLGKIREEYIKISAKRLYWKEAAQKAIIIVKTNEKIFKINQKQKIIRSEINDITQNLQNIFDKLSKAKAILKETSSASWLTRKWRSLPKPEDQQQTVASLKTELGGFSLRLDEKNAQIKTLDEEKIRLTSIVETFRHKYSLNPEKAIEEASAIQNQYTELNQNVRDLNRFCQKERFELTGQIDERLKALSGWGIVGHSSGSAEILLNSIKDGFATARSEVSEVSEQTVRSELNTINKKIVEYEDEIREIDGALSKVEEVVIGEASIIATTLSRAYLRDSIHARRFDTVILDEASMAPVPALWVAAGLADSNAIVVGDPKQLPPIVISNHELAEKWLGRDIFEVAGLTGYGDKRPYLVTLRRQYRMHPKISAIANQLIYDNGLEDGAWRIGGTDCDLSDIKCDSQSLAQWYNFQWGHDYPVLLIDTGSTNAWVTSVSKGSRASRLNFLSATICAFVADQMFSENRPDIIAEQDPRILMVSPYRPHAKLLDLLIKDQKLNGEVVSGTVHSFQGSEADVVIMDLVNDEPHWKVGMFMQQLDVTYSRLINVAITRAKRRLVVVGDFDYIERTGKKAFVGKKFVPFLKNNYPCIDALELIPDGLAARTAKAQSTVLGDEIEPESDRIVVTQEQFFPYLRSDISKARKRVVVYSAFLTVDRISIIEFSIRAAYERGVMIYVVTKSLQDRKKRDVPVYLKIEQTLEDWGVIIIHKNRMHEKIVFVDDNIIWVGSLNTMSFSNTREIMERRVSRKVVADYIQILRMNELLQEYEKGKPTCPICNSEMVATEGRDDPFYWRCIQNDCYKRSIDQPAIQGGIIDCKTCGGKVEFGYWGNKPHWRCVENKRHRQPIAKTHLRLPDMLKIIPKKEVTKVYKYFGIKKVQKPKKKEKAQQISLFD